MDEIFTNVCVKGMLEKEYILQFLPSLKISGNSGTSNGICGRVISYQGKMEEIAVKGLNHY